ncbi:MAG: hypothetical protein QXG39_05405 [Candidatus Aenigmatarchaeota archaeon]
MKTKLMWINGRLQEVKEIKLKKDLDKRKEIWLRSSLLNLLRQKPMKVNKIRRYFLEKKRVDISPNVFTTILMDLKKQKVVNNRKRLWFLNDSDYAKKLIRPMGEDVADELADFFDLEKIDKKFAKQLVEKPKRC